MTLVAIALIVGRLYYFIGLRDCSQIPHIAADTSNYSYAKDNSAPEMAASFLR